MTMKMRHWAIIGATATGIAAIVTQTPLSEIAGLIAFFGIVVTADKANSMRG